MTIHPAPCSPQEGPQDLSPRSPITTIDRSVPHPEPSLYCRVRCSRCGVNAPLDLGSLIFRTFARQVCAGATLMCLVPISVRVLPSQA